MSSTTPRLHQRRPTMRCSERLLLIIAVLFSGCKPDHPTVPPSRNDDALRTFMGIRTVDARFALPDSATAYYPAAVFFADGKEVARVKGPAMMNLGSHQQRPFHGDIQLLWQFESDQFRRAALVDGGNSRDLTDAFPHWQEFSSAGWRPVPMDERLSYQGISILGLLASSPPQVYPAPEKLASAGKYVVAIGIVYGSDAAALERQFLSTSQ